MKEKVTFKYSWHLRNDCLFSLEIFRKLKSDYHAWFHALKLAFHKKKYCLIMLETLHEKGC